MSMEYWKYPIAQICSELTTHSFRGLTSEEAAHRLEEKGRNILPRKGRVVWWKLLLTQMSSVIIWLLIGAAIVAAALGEVVDAWAIIAIVLLNGILGFLQEYRAEKSLEALQKLAAPTTKVIRSGILHSIPSSELVPGDLILLEAGDRVPADGRIVNHVHLTIEEASLTGESIPVGKTDQVYEQELSLGDRKNMVFLGTTVASGKGHILITETGLHTEMGKIAAQILVAKKEETPLQKQLDRLGKKLVYICLAVIAIIFGLGVLSGSGIVDMLLVALSLAVAAIPEGLPAAVTISLSIGVRKMAEKKALIRRLSSVETLGSTTVICTDKTGTLTQNAMTVSKIYVDHSIFNVTGNGYAPEGEFQLEGKKIEPSDGLYEALKIGALCNNANILEGKEGWVVAGDPTEGALLTAARKAGLSKEDLEAEHSLLQEIPFDSERKMMSMLRKDEGGQRLFVKGALDVLIPLCQDILIEGEMIPLSKEEKEKIQEVNQELAGKAFRILAVAYQSDFSKEMEKDLVFVGLLAMRDPPREEAKEAIANCKAAHVETVMMTGDHKETAIAIARDLGMMNQKGRAIDGNELDQLSDEELQRQLGEITVFSRISAQHKLRIVKSYKARGDVIAMTGDGVNDAPALQEADIGVAMGITGTDVTKESADMVILDDNFASIVRAIQQGRGIYDNIVKFVSYLLSSNIAEILVIFLVMLFGIRTEGGKPFVALLPVQLLWMNLVTDGLPAISLAFDPVDPRAMQKRPRKKGEEILNPRFSLFTISISLLVTVGALVACFWGLKEGSSLAHTMTFTTLIVLELVRVQMIRRQYGIKLFSNWLLLVALGSSFILQLLVVYVPPLQIIFGTVALGAADWGVIFGVGFALWWAGLWVTHLFHRS